MLEKYLDQLLPYFQVLGIVSIFTFFLSLLFIPWFIGRLPEDYFLNNLNGRSSAKIIRTSLPKIILKNIIGLLLVVIGIVMLFVPGQGLLTIVIGILCMSFPGKQQLTNYVIKKKSLQKSLNWSRRKMSRSPFLWK